MKTYVILLIITVLSLMVYKKYCIKFFSLLPYIVMTFVCGFRNKVGVDYETYKKWYYDILEKKGWYSNTEMGYKYVTLAVSKIGGNYQLIFLLMAIVTAYCYYRFIINNSCDFVLSTMIYMCFGIFYFSSFNGSRQAMAISMFLYALKYITKGDNDVIVNYNRKELLSYFLIIIVAMLFHKSAFVFLIFPLLVKRINGKHFIHFITISFMGTVVIKFGILDYLLSMFFPVYYRYAYDKYELSKGYFWFLVVGIFIIFLYSRLHMKNCTVYMHLLVFSLALVAIVFLTGRYEMFLSRYASWGMSSIIIILPELGKRVKQKNIYKSIVYAVCFIYFFSVTLRGAMMLPYSYNFKVFG